MTAASLRQVQIRDRLGSKLTSAHCAEVTFSRVQRRQQADPCRKSKIRDRFIFSVQKILCLALAKINLSRFFHSRCHGP